MIRARHRPLFFYLCGTGSWFVAHGVQNVMFAWLITIVLQESPVMLGIAQMALYIPTTLFMLLGGWVADRFQVRTVCVVTHLIAIIPLLLLVVCLLLNILSYEFMILYAISIGTMQAMIFPARDASLNKVARGEIQRTVLKTTLVQYLSQMSGIAVAGTAQFVGSVFVTLLQAGVLLVGAVSYSQLSLRQDNSQPSEEPIIWAAFGSIREGGKAVFQHSTMRTVILLNLVMSVCFMGSYIVTIPILIRDVFGGSSADIALVYFLNSLGLVLAIGIMLVRVKRVARPGLALCISTGLGALVLGSAGGLGTGILIFAGILFLWGMCGGIVITMSRTLMQELAPERQRGQVLGIFSLSFLGLGPLFAPIWGYVIDLIGAPLTLIVASSVMAIFLFVLILPSRLWRR